MHQQTQQYSTTPYLQTAIIAAVAVIVCILEAIFNESHADIAIATIFIFSLWVWSVCVVCAAAPVKLMWKIILATVFVAPVAWIFIVIFGGYL